MGRKCFCVRNCIMIVLLCALFALALLPLAFSTTARAAIVHGEFEADHAGAIDLNADPSLTELTDGNSYYLTDDLSRDLTIAVGASVRLCLNGHVINGSGATAVIAFDDSSGAELYLYDCHPQTENNVTYSVNGKTKTVTIMGGAIIGGSYSWGGGIQVAGNTLFMYGGTIAGNSATGAGANSYGGGVNLGNGYMHMYGGVIKDNYSAGFGGGVSVGGGSGSRFHLYGGTIEGNTAGRQGGGIYVGDNSSTLQIGGSAADIGVIRVRDNAVGIIENNVQQNPQGAIYVGGKIVSGSKIGITLDSSVTAFGNGFGTHNAGVNPNDIFDLDNVNGYVCKDNGAGGLTFVVAPVINIPAKLEWQIIHAGSGAAYLESGPVYEYTADGEVEYSTTPQAGAKEIAARNSVTYYTGANIEIGLVLSDIIPDEFTASYSTAGGGASNVFAFAGKHVTTVKLTANGEYEFTCGYASDSERGIKVAVAADKKSVVIEKTWFIISNRSDDTNAFLSDRTTGVSSYGIVQSFAFGVNQAQFPVYRPRLKYGDGSANVRYTLSSVSEDKTEIAGALNFTNDDFDEYINNSMPAGIYTLVVKVDEVTVDIGTQLWWSNTATTAEIVSPAYQRTYSFTVTPAQIKFGLEKTSEYGYTHYDWWLADGADKTQMFAEFEKLVADNAPSFLTVERKGHWANSVWDKYYYSDALDNYEISYNFARLYNNRYYAPSQLVNSIGGGANGTYRVYFRISAPAHADFGTGNDRYECFFTVNVFQKVGLPRIENPKYTGARVTPLVSSDTRFTVEWDKNDDYVSGGKHYFMLKLSDPAHYRWDDNIATVDSEKLYAKVEFDIIAVTNTWLRTPNIVGWEYGSYSKDRNYIVAIPTYGTAESVVMSIEKEVDGKREAVDGLNSFTVDENGYVDSDVEAKISALGSGTYWLTAEVPATNDYSALAKQSASFMVTKTKNHWTKPISVVAWADGDYNPKKNVITAESYAGEPVVVIVDVKSGKQYYNSATGLNRLKDAPVGSYRLTATVDGNDSYSALNDSVEFSVFEAAGGIAWWVILIIVLCVLFVVFLVLFILVKKGIVQLMTEKMVVAMRTRADTDATIAAVRAGKIAAEAARAAEAAAANYVEEPDPVSDAEEAQPEEEEESEEEKAYEPDENDVEVPSSGDFSKAFKVNSNEQVAYGKTVLSKLITSPDIVKTRYSEIKNYLLAYKKARANMSRARESYYIGRKCYARIAMRGKTLCLYLALNPSDYVEKYNVEDMLSVKQYADTPCLLRIRSDRAVRRAKALIDELAALIGATPIERKPENYAELFKSIEQLEKKRLLSYNGRKQKSAFNNNNKRGE